MYITVLLLQHGTEDISLLTFSESTLAVQNENETDEGKDLIETNLRDSDKVRNRLNAHVMLSPFSQCNYSAYLYIERPEDKSKLSFLFKDNPYHFNFLLSNRFSFLSFYIPPSNRKTRRTEALRVFYLLFLLFPKEMLQLELLFQVNIHTIQTYMHIC